MARPLCLPLLLGAALVASACDLVEDLTNGFKTCQDAGVVLLNSEQTLGPVHITGPGEGFAADNLLESGFSRRLSLCLERGDRKMFRAGGLDRQVIGTATCVAERARYEGVVPRVVWGPAGFSCQGW
jgi:hypothetical protein